MKHRARKRFGQNFLQDRHVIDRIIGAIAPGEGEAIVEIGPGLGALTRPLLERCGELDVVELDRDLPAKLQARCAGLGELRIHNADALNFDFSALRQGAALRIVGNLPYNISTPLLFHLLAHISAIEDMHVMLQKEVAERLAAAPGSKTYGRLSVMVQYHCRVELLLDIPPSAFKPAPKVDSAFVRLTPRPPSELPAVEPGALNRVVAQAFSQRRKTLRNTLSELLAPETIRGCGIDPAARAETVDLDGFIRLAQAYSAADAT